MEVINSFFSNIKDKLSNPFFGTLILVLIIHHWELWYTLFNFDSDCMLDGKIIFVRTYIHSKLTFTLLALDVLQAIFYMFIGYLIIIGTRSLVIWIEFGLMPMITGKIINKNVVMKTEYDDVVKEREGYFDQYEEQRKNVRIFSKTIDEQTQQIKEKDENLLDQSNKISQIVKELDAARKNIEELEASRKQNSYERISLTESIDLLKNDNEIKNIKIENFSNIFFNPSSRSFFMSTKSFPPIIIEKVLELKKENKWNAFLALGDFYEVGGNYGSQALYEMIQKGISFKENSKSEFTPLGKIIWTYRDSFENYGV